MGTEWAALVERAVREMNDGRADAARKSVIALDGAARSGGTNDAVALQVLWQPFLGLLNRRGYTVSPEGVLTISLDQVLRKGPGFDLYELARCIAMCDQRQARRLASPGSSMFPLLHPFAAEIRR